MEREATLSDCLPSRDPAGQIVQGILQHTGLVDLEVDVGAPGGTSVAHQTDNLALAHLLALIDQDAAHVAVGGVVPAAAVLDNDAVTIAAVPAGQDHRAALGGQDIGAIGGADIDALVVGAADTAG